MKALHDQCMFANTGVVAKLLGTLLCCSLLSAAHAQTNYQTLRSFGFPQFSGANPRAPLLVGSDGALYGTTEYGGASDAGTVFKLSTDGTGYMVLKSFTGSGGDGSGPYSGLIEGTNGVLYGTTYFGGTNGAGTIFCLNKDGGSYAVLNQFNTNGADGQNPRSELMQGSDGALYGTTYAGGISNLGTVFTLNLDGSGYSVLKSFTGASGDGSKPYAGLVEGTNGALYGTTYWGGNTNQGAVFKLNKDGGGFTLLKSYSGSLTNYDVNGRKPFAGLLLCSDGFFYGTTRRGGSNDSGTVFKLDHSGSNFTVLHWFTNNGDGIYPHARLLEGTNGALFGTTHNGGISNVGTVFTLNKDGSGYTVLTNFDITFGNGYWPEAGLVQAADGLLYGTTYGGGANNYGTVFKLNPDGSGLTVVQSFSLSGGDGRHPSAAIEASDGAVTGQRRLAAAMMLERCSR